MQTDKRNKEASSSDDTPQISLIRQRKIEAGIVAPIYEKMRAAIGRNQADEIIREAIVAAARAHGSEISARIGSNTLADFGRVLSIWTQNDAMEMDLLEKTDQTLSFNVTRCRYAEFYREMGIPELGYILSCSRDFALMEGFNPNIKLTRTQTILTGAPYCDFRYKTENGR